MASKLPDAKAIVTTLGSRGAVCLARVDAKESKEVKTEVTRRRHRSAREGRVIRRHATVVRIRSDPRRGRQSPGR
jgi:acyl-coenzyme A thioesterase PaaI-like protein